MAAIKRILVTGGAGFLGSHLCERLVQQAGFAPLDHQQRIGGPAEPQQAIGCCAVCLCHSARLRLAADRGVGCVQHTVAERDRLFPGRQRSRPIAREATRISSI